MLHCSQQGKIVRFQAMSNPISRGETTRTMSTIS